MRFVVQKFVPRSKQTHYYLRLEKAGVFKSWAVPKGIPKKSGVKRLAIPVGDYRIDRPDFEGQVDRGKFGKGRISLLDRGEYQTLKWEDREIKFCLRGKIFTGQYVLFRVEFKKTGETNWLLEKQRRGLDSGSVRAKEIKSDQPAPRPAPKLDEPRKKKTTVKTAPKRYRPSSSRYTAGYRRRRTSFPPTRYRRRRGILYTIFHIARLFFNRQLFR